MNSFQNCNIKILSGLRAKLGCYIFHASNHNQYILGLFPTNDANVVAKVLKNIFVKPRKK